MKLELIVFIALSLLVAIVAAGSDDLIKPVESTRNSLVPQKLFDFQRFKSLFKKSYGSILEELARKKIFFAKAFRAFLSFISYKHFKSSSYLKVNELSDWTDDELESMDMNVKKSSNGLNNLDGANSSDEQQIQAAANLEDIELKLKEIVEEHRNEPGYNEIVSELKEHKDRRKKRDTHERVRHSVSIDDLLGAPEVEKESQKWVNKVESNNPDYEMPELSSFGLTEEKPKPMEEWQSKLIGNLPGANLIGSLVSAATSLLGSSNQSNKDNLKPTTPSIVYHDHRRSNCFTPVKNQKQCGSCYIFSTTALYEWAYCHESGKSVKFSEQYPLDCGARIGMLGCKGGNEMEVSEFYGSYGVELLNSYPYRHRVDSCPYEPSVTSYKMGYLRVQERRLLTIEHSQFGQYIEKTPILLGLGVPENFHEYGGGVDIGLSCSSRRGHSMLVVGDGNEDGLDYWLLRNSYGASWGEKGYYKIAKLARACFLEAGIGWVLNPDRTVFGKLNTLNDGKAVKERLNYDSSLLSHFFPPPGSPSSESDTNIVTPPSF